MKFKNYEGKATAYLDQNILDLFVSSDDYRNLFDVLKSEFQVVYSDETLREIQRSGGEYVSRFLNVLKDLNALHLKIVLEQPNFIITDEATLSNRDPFDAYNEYCQNDIEYNDLLNAFNQTLFKLAGERSDESFHDINYEQKIAFRNLIQKINTQLNILKKDFPEIIFSFKEEGIKIEAQLEKSLNEFEEVMDAYILDKKDWSGIKDFREATGVSPKELNNIQPPNIIEKILAIYKRIPPFSNMNITVESFFSLINNPIYPERPYYKHQKVTVIYNMLNTIGYYPDSQVKKERRFIASISDTSHASIASFCNILLSRDEYFIKKVKAACEYLEIPTEIYFVSLKP